MDQTDIAITTGLIVGAPLGVAGLHAITDWSHWICIPLGGISGLVIMTVVVFLLIGLIGRVAQGSNKS